MKNIKWKLVSELMKNSKQSDRELAKIIGVSQPTVTRTRTRLEKEGYIKEYTIVPDFAKLGFELMAITFVHYSKTLSAKEYDEVKRSARDVEKQIPHASLLAMSGEGFGHERVFITFHENYSSFTRIVRMVRQLPFGSVANIQSFLVTLTSKEIFQPCTLSIIANYISKMKEEKH